MAKFYKNLIDSFECEISHRNKRCTQTRILINKQLKITTIIHPMITTLMKNNKNINTRIKDKNNLSIRSTMMKIKLRKKDSNKEFNHKKISSFSKKLIFLVYQKLTKSKNLLSQKKQESSLLTLTKSTDGESGLMLNSDPMNFLI